MWWMILFSHLAAADTVVSQVVGQASDIVTTSREVKINTFIEVALFSEGANPVPEIDEKKFDKEVSRTLLEIVVAKEADVFNAAPIPDDDLAKSLSITRSLASRPEHAAYWTKLAPSSQELKNVIVSKLKAKRFIQFKTRASIVPVTDAEALQYFQKNRIRFGNAPFAQFKESIKSLLAQEQASQRLHDWFEILQRKYRVRKVSADARAS